MPLDANSQGVGVPDTPATPISSLDLANAQALVGTVSQIRQSLSADNNAIITQINAIATAVTQKLLGGVAGTTANAVMRTKSLSSGSSAGSIQNSLVTIDNSGNTIIPARLQDASEIVSPSGSNTGVTTDGSLKSFQVLGTSGPTSGGLFGRWSADTGASNIFLYKSRATSIGSHTSGAVTSGDQLGALFFYGDDGTGDFSAAEIRALVDGTVSAGTIPMRLEFLTAPSGDSPTIRYTIDNTGNSKFSFSAAFTPRGTLTDAATIAWDARANQVAKVLLTSGVGATRVLGAPTNLLDGGTYILFVTQSSTGSNALTYNAVYKWPGGLAPVLSTANNAVDILTFVSDGTNMYGVAQKGFA